MKSLFEKNSPGIFLLFLTIVFSIILRLYNLSGIPEGFQQDEAAFGYNAYSLIKTGRDEYGIFLPLILKSFGDYKLALFPYSVIPFISLFGLSEYSVRFASVFFSIMSLFIVYRIIRKIFISKKLALLSIAILTLTPWFLTFSRMASETMLSILCYYVAIYFFLSWDKRRTCWQFFISIFFTILGVLSYYSAWYPAILILVVYFFSIKNHACSFAEKSKYLLSITLPLILMAVIIVSTKGVRLKQINTIEHNNAYGLLQEQIREDQNIMPIFFLRLLHNKAVFYPRFIFSKFFDTLNGNFLFMKGDTAEMRFSIPYSGELFLWFAPFIFLGYLFFVKKYSGQLVILLSAVILFPFLGSGSSVYGSEGQRTLIAAPVFAFLASFGLLSVIKKLRQYSGASVTAVTLVAVYEFVFFLHQYCYHAKVHKPWYSNQGERKMVHLVNSLAPDYGKVYIAGNPYIFFYFYNNTDPKIAQQDSQNIRQDSLGYIYRTEYSDYQGMATDCPAAGKMKILFVCSGTYIPKKAKIIERLTYGDSQPHYILIEFTDKTDAQVLPPNYHYLKDSEILPVSYSSDWLTEDQLAEKKD